MIKRFYLDTSVMGGQFDREFSLDTSPFFDAISKGQFIIIISDLLEAELIRAPQQVRNLLSKIPIRQIERINLTQEAADIADKYIQANVVGRLVGQIVSILPWRHLLKLTCL